MQRAQPPNETASNASAPDSTGSADSPDSPDSPVELSVGPRLRPLGGLQVNRVWPTARRRLIGPFIFLDHLQAAELAPGSGLDVPPHPHIGLATLTYLFEGQLMHADSLGCRQAIRPGELNWMTAGRGITHSERSGDTERAEASRLHGMQSWVALPLSHETCTPSFEHYEAGDLPRIEFPGVALILLAGRAFGARSPAATQSGLFYLDAHLAAGGRFVLPAALGERGVYIVSGSVNIAGTEFEAGRLLVLSPGADIAIESSAPARLMLLGGDPFEGDRHIWWNFVASTPERIEQAKRDWKERRFPDVPGDNDFMPLPE